MKRKSGTFLSWLSMQLGAKFGIGIITIVPFFATVWIFWWIFIHIDDLLQPIIKEIWGHNIPGVGFGATLLLILLAGFIASNVIGRRLIRYAESVIPGMPIVHQLYTGIKQIVESFSASQGVSRMPPVLIEFPKKGMKSLGFITSELSNEPGKKLFVVFIPTVPNPTTGFAVVVDESQIIRTTISIEDALKMVVSAGKVITDEVAANLLADSQMP